MWGVIQMCSLLGDMTATWNTMCVIDGHATHLICVMRSKLPKDSAKDWTPQLPLELYQAQQ